MIEPMILKAIIILFVTLLLSQLISALIDLHKTKKWTWDFFIKLGGMPSSHSATVAALATIIYYIEGFGTLFLVTAVFAIFIFRDSFGVRFEVGEQAKYLNKKFKTTFIDRVGHKKSEVLAGILLGIIIAIIGMSVF